MAEGNGVFPPENLKAEFDGIVARYPKKTAALIPILMRLQDEFRHIKTEHMDALAEYLDTTPAHVLGVVTFYTMFSQKKRGRRHIYLCKTLSCHIRGAAELLGVFEEKLGVKANDGEASEDGQFSIDTAECLGVCEQAPCILVDDELYGDISPEMVDQIIEELRS